LARSADRAIVECDSGTWTAVDPADAATGRFRLALGIAADRETFSL